MSFDKILRLPTLIALLVFLGMGFNTYGKTSTNVLTLSDSLRVGVSDSLKVGITDSLNIINDSLAISGTKEKVESTLERPAFSAAKDSVIEDFRDGKSIIYYYGEVSVTYGDIALKADYMRYDLDNNTVFARGTKDSTGTITGMPEMSDQGTTYTMEELTYNFTTRKAKIKHMVTQQSEGILRGENLKMMPDQSINIAGGQYTVCDAEHPHYFLKMTAAKVMTKPNQKTVFGPAYVVVEDVPLPIVLPFGFVPEMPDRASGVLIPTYGEETARGLYLRDLGYSFVFGNYLDLAITGDIYSYGSWSTEITSRYKKRYAFDGNLSLSYSNDITGEKGSADFFQSKNFGVSWSHSQDSKARPGTSFKASVNFSSPSNSKYNSNNISESLQNQVSSSISYSKTWSGMSLSVNALHSQNSRDSSYSITLPNITFSVNRFYPFKQKDRVGKEKIYEKISLSYNTTLQNKINFKVSELDEGNFWNKLQNGMTHNFSIGLPSFNLFKYFQFSPAVSYGMNWYFREKQLKYNEDTQQVESYFTDQFSTFGISQNFSSGISMSTRLYGIFNFGKKSNLQAIRHMITPSISFSYKPEMGTAANGYTSLTYINSDGKEVIKEYNKYSDMIYSPVSKGKTAALSFAIGNNLEAKIKNPQDTTGKGEEKVKLLDQLNFSGSYNFLADSMRLSNISVTASTTIFGKLGINGNATFDPYAINERGIRYNELNIIKEGGFNIARLTNASASLSYSLSADGKYEGNDGTKDKKDTNSDYAKVYYNPVTGEYIPGGWVYYLNPSIPWSLSFNLNYSFSRTYQYLNEQLLIKDNHIQTISISGQVHLTKALNMNFNTGFDLTKLKMTTSQLSATYDLHCFAISVSWVPNGQWESWSFRIAAKASALSDLLQFKKASSYWDN